MLVTMNRKHAELIDKLVFIADGDLDLVRGAIRAVSSKNEADLKDVVAYIVCNRQKK